MNASCSNGWINILKLNLEVTATNEETRIIIVDDDMSNSRGEETRGWLRQRLN